MEQELKLVEVFESLQGEGANTGLLALFIRFTGCNLSCHFCDTAYNKLSLKITPSLLLQKISAEYPNCKNIIWTGGEPTLQLTEEIVALFSNAGYWQAIESNGLVPAPKGIDYITLSPKGDTYPRVRDNYLARPVEEVRIAVANGDQIPPLEELPRAKHYFLSPIFNGEEMVPENISYCEQLIKKMPKWRLSLQMHKLIGIR